MTENVKMFRALSVLEDRALPKLHGHLAYWRAPVPAPAQAHVTIPKWNWTGIHADEYGPDETITLDVNGSYMAALGSVDIGFTDLKRMGPIDGLAIHPREVMPGYYRIKAPGWAFGPTIVSPLGGDAEHMVGKPIWIAHPTLVLLLELLAQNALGYFDIIDSWVSSQRCNFRDWNRLLKQTREALLDAVDVVHPEGAPSACSCSAACQDYRAFKEGYGSALSMMRTGNGCKVRRPDWSDAVYAQHAAARWRNAWRFSSVGPLLYMGSTDELTVRRADIPAALSLTIPAVKLDESGRLLGHYKTKAVKATTNQDDERQAVTAVGNTRPLNTAFEDDDIL